MAQDERFSESLVADLRRVFGEGIPGDVDGYTVKWRLWFMGEPLHAIADNFRLMRKGKCRATNVACNEHFVVEGKIGVLSVHGNYSILCGDPYALCQSVFGLPVTGLLKAGQLYNKYWIDEGAEYVACFRAPMSCHNNIRRMQVANSEEMAYWYRYMTACTMMNAWDTTTQALNGAD